MAGRKRKSTRSRQHMAELGRKGGKSKGRGRAKKTSNDEWNKKEAATEELEEEDLP